MIKDFLLNFEYFGPKNSIRNPYISDIVIDNLLEMESIRKLLSEISNLMTKTNEYAYKSFDVLEKSNKFTEKELELGKKQYISRVAFLRSNVEGMVSIYNANVSFPKYEDVAEKFKGSKEESISKEHEKELLKKIDKEENPTVDEDDPGEDFKKIRSVKKFLKGLDKFFKSPVGSILMDIIIHGPGMAQDVNIIRALYRQFILADQVNFTEEETLAMSLLLKKSSEFKKDMLRINGYFKGQGFDNKVKGFMNNYTKGINTGGFDYREISKRVKDFHNELTQADLNKTFPENKHIVDFFNVCYKFLSFSSIRDIITNAFNRNSISSEYNSFFPQFIKIGTENKNDVEKFRDMVGLYFSSRNKTMSESVFNALHFVLNQAYYTDKVMDEYKNLRIKYLNAKKEEKNSNKTSTSNNTNTSENNNNTDESSSVNNNDIS